MSALLFVDAIIPMITKLLLILLFYTNIKGYMLLWRVVRIPEFSKNLQSIYSRCRLSRHTDSFYLSLAMHAMIEHLYKDCFCIFLLWRPLIMSTIQLWESYPHQPMPHWNSFSSFMLEVLWVFPQQEHCTRSDFPLVSGKHVQ